MSKNLFRLITILLLMVALTACGGENVDSSPEGNNQDDTNNEVNDEASDVSTEQGSDEGGDLETVTIQIDGGAVPYYAPLYVAQEEGYFAEQGLNVEFMYGPAATIVTNVAAENVEFGFPNADSVITARAEDIPVTVAHTTYQNGLGATIFKGGEEISTPEDLKDKTIGVTSYGSPNYIQLQVLLEAHGLNLRDVNVKIIGQGSILNALVADEVDAIVFSMLRTVELQQQGVNAEEFRSDENLPSHGNVLITSDDYLEENPDTVKGFIRGLNQGIEYIVDGNAEKAIAMSVEKHAPSFEGREEEVLEIFNSIFIPYLWQSDLTDESGFGTADLDRWRETIEIMESFAIIENKVDPEEFVKVNLLNEGE